MTRTASPRLLGYAPLAAVGLVAALALRRPELWVQRVSAEDVVREVLATVPTPRAEDAVAEARA